MNKSQISKILEKIPDDVPIEFYFTDRFSVLENTADIEKINIEYNPKGLNNIKFEFTGYFMSDVSITINTGEFRKILESKFITDESLIVGTDNYSDYPLERIDISYTNSGYKVRLHLKEEVVNERNSAA